MTAFNNLQELIDLLADAPAVTELSVSGPGGAQITIKRPQTASGPLPSAVSAAQIHAMNGLSAAGDQNGIAPAEAQPPPAPKPVEVSANRVGIFHAAKPPVAMSDAVKSGQIVGYIESMKLMNEIRAASDGIVSDQLVDEGMPVEYGQPLFRLSAPASAGR